MKKLLIIIIITIYTLLILSGLMFAELSDETLEIVDDLRWKHYGHGSLILDDDSVMIFRDGQIEWIRDFLRIWVEDGIFYVETQDGKWFIEMTKMEE